MVETSKGGENIGGGGKSTDEGINIDKEYV
jgi:hypothetical protein